MNIEINVAAQPVFFKAEHLAQIKALFAETFGYLPPAMPAVEWPVFETVPTDSGSSLVRCNITHTARSYESMSEYDFDEFKIQGNVAAMWKSLGPLLEGSAQMVITDPWEESSVYITGPDDLSIDTHIANMVSMEIGDVLALYSRPVTPVAAAHRLALEQLLQQMGDTGQRPSAELSPAPLKPDAGGLTSRTVFILANNSEGSPEMLVTDVMVSDGQYNEGEHYAIAERRARADGYELATSFDSSDPAARTISRDACFTLDADDAGDETAQAPCPTGG